ncbi:Importin-4 [Camellia lanceoleosa]|uniref:Importin-4 n=1 Tax=Camellia lanceoleosa TaxID=1840588 RepID=A0ACC0IHV2_9ERIC|nr:Importin-4 [Camellia lanceoleosa]
MAQSLELLLIQFLMPDNDARRQAEDQIKRLAKDPQVIPALIHHLRTAKTPNVRQLSAVLLRKKITGHWAKLSPHLRQLVKQSLIESITLEHSPPVRRASANVVSIIAKYAVPAGEWPDLLPFLFQCSQSPQEDHREVALILFSSLTETIGNSFRPHFADLQTLLLKCLQDETSNRVRVAALKAVGSFLEFTHDGAEVGCLELMKDKLEPVLHIVLGALRDPEQMVRGAASFALGQFAEHLQPEIVSHYESVLPCILNALEDASDEVKEKSYYALAAFCENMGEEILPFLDPLMGKLLAALQNSPRNLQETCMSAIGSVASAAEQAFIPFAEQILELMKTFIVLTNDEDLCSRARATELVGIIAMSVGRIRMEPILPPFIEAAISGFGLEFSELREYTHGFFSNVAEILDEDLPSIFHIGFGGVSSDDEAHDEPRVRNISIRTGVLDEKAAATQALGLFALHTKSSFAPYLEESLKILVRHSTYFHEDVDILTAAQAVFQGQNVGPTKAREILDTVMNIYIKTMTEDDDKEVVAQDCMSIADIIKDIGYIVVEPYMPRLVEATLVLLREESACQQKESDGEIDDDDAEHDEVLMDAVSDLLPAFANSMGIHFAPIFEKLFGPLMKFAKASRPPQDRTMVVACLAEVAQHMGPPIAGYIDAVMPLVLKELASPVATNRRNAAFCIGELCKNERFLYNYARYYGDALHGLYPLFGESEPDDAVRDNAAGAVARMIMVHPESIPLNQVLPVFLKVLPLKEDHEESMAVYSCVCNLVLSSNPQSFWSESGVVCVLPAVSIFPAWRHCSFFQCSHIQYFMFLVIIFL